MRWLRSVSARFAARATDATSAAVSLIPRWFSAVLWQIASQFPELAQRAYGGNAVVYACLRLLSQSVPEPPLRAYRENANGDSDPLPRNHPLARLIARPNELMTEFEFWELTELHIGLTGAAYWWKQRTNGGQIAALWPLRPDRVAPAYSTSNVDGERLLRGWAYYPPGGGVPLVLPRTEVLAFGLPHPGGESGGVVEFLGPCQVLANEIAADNEATTFVGALLANYAQPSMLIKTKQPIRDKDIARRLKAQFMAELGGSHKGEPALLDADTEIEKLSFDLQQLEFPDLRALAESRIAAAFGVPAILVGLKVGLDKATYSNYESAREFFAETTLSTKWRRYSDQYTNDVAAEFDPGLVCRFDTSQVKALAGQRQRHAEPIKDGFSRGAVTVNEYRERVLGLPPLPQGDVIYLPRALVVVASDGPLVPAPPAPALPAPAPEPPAARAAVKALADDVEREHEEATDRLAATVRPAIAEYLDGLRERIVSRWNETAKAWPDADDLLGPDDGGLLDVLRPHWEVTMAEAYERAGARLGVTLSFDLANENVERIIEAVGTRERGIHETTRGAVQDAIRRAAAEGLSIPDVAAILREIPGLSAGRALTIARTETAVAYNLASLLGYEETGLVSEVEVLDGRDFDEECRSLHGQRKPLHWARTNPIGHPRCRRAFAPLLRE